jgi:hypothetical protein
MPKNNMSGSIPEALGDLEQLAFLSLYDNLQIKGSIPARLGDLKQLTTLELHRNRLTGVVPSLPFNQYTKSNCYLQAPTSPTNNFTCPLPPVSSSSLLEGLLAVY